MKQILLFVVCLFGLGTMTVQAQENSEPTDLMLYQQATKAISAQEVKAEEKSIKESLHEEAVKALEQQRFVVTFHAGEWGSSRRIDLDSRRNFLMIDGQKAFFQKSVDEVQVNELLEPSDEEFRYSSGLVSGLRFYNFVKVKYLRVSFTHRLLLLYRIAGQTYS